MAIRLAVQENLIPGASLIEKWDRAQAIGFEGIELRGEGGPPFRARLPELEAAIRHGAVFPTVCVISDRFIGDFDPARRAEALDTMKTLLSVVASVGGKGAITPAAWGMHSNRLPPFKAPREPGEDREVLLEMLTALGDHAAREGVLVLLEPLNRYEDHMLNTLGEGVALLSALGHPSVKLMADFFHMNIEEDDIAGALEAAFDHVAHVHVADSNRFEPGRGHMDFARPFAALLSRFYDGFAALECRFRNPPEEALRDAFRVLAAARGPGSPDG